jgi:hypothetical protein
MLSKLYDQVRTSWDLQAEGREQRTCLNEQFHQCVDAQVEENELKSQLAKTTWFKLPSTKHSPYLTLNNSSSSSFISFDQAFVNIANALQWDDNKKAKMIKAGIVRDLCFRCPSSNVDTKEFTDRVIATRFFGQAITTTTSIADYIPPRRDAIPFLALDLFTHHTPSRITWIQVRDLYYDFHTYAKRELDLDEMFYGLQTKEYNKLNKKQRAKNEAIRENQIPSMEVPFSIFIRAFTRQICPLDLKQPENSDPFWSTSVGEAWTALADNANEESSKHKKVKLDDDEETKVEQLINWQTVYQGFTAICPKVHSPQAVIASSSIKSTKSDQNIIQEMIQQSFTDTKAASSAQETTTKSVSKSDRMVESIKKQYAALLKKKKPEQQPTSSSITPETSLPVTQMLHQFTTKNEKTTVPIEEKMQPLHPELESFMSPHERVPSFQLRTPYSKSYSSKPST